MTADPQTLSAGQETTLSVHVAGPYANVASVYAVVREAPDMALQLYNDGTNGDAESDDRIWTVTVPVPPDAQPGVYHLDFTVRDTQGNVLAMKEAEVTNASLTGSIAVTVR
jgi:hypothetical protein